MPYVRILMLSLSVIAASIGTAGTSAPSRSDAEAVMARLRSRVGEWKATSSRGWTETATFTLVGKGSSVMELSHFVDTPQDSMATLFYLDDGRLLLTHYCEAGNQPRLVAAEVSPAAVSVTFTFLDGTNLLARPGHMHRVRMRFIDADHFVSQWTFFSKGHETWMEEITHERVTPKAQRASE